MRIKAKINKSQVSASVRKAMESTEEEIKLQLRGMASDLVAYSPVWSGAYVTSHSFVPKGSGAGRMRKSFREKGPVPAADKKQEAYGLLLNDIQKVDFLESGGGVFRNRSPHAYAVENGSTPKNASGYNVYRKTAAKWG